MSFTFHSTKLEEFIKRYDLDVAISFMRKIFKFSYTKTRGDSGVYVWFGDRDWNYKSKCPMAHVGQCSIIFVDYTEDQVIEKFTHYYKLKAFL